MVPTAFPDFDRDSLDERVGEILARQPEVLAGWIFGSMARDEARPESDLDVAILVRDRNPSPLEWSERLATMAASLEEVVPGRAVDVVLLEPQGPIFRHRVLSDGRLVLDRDRERRVDFESDTYVRYFDFLPTWKLAQKYAREGLRHRLDALK